MNSALMWLEVLQDVCLLAAEESDWQAVIEALMEKDKETLTSHIYIYFFYVSPTFLSCTQQTNSISRGLCGYRYAWIILSSLTLPEEIHIPFTWKFHGEGPSHYNINDHTEG